VAFASADLAPLAFLGVIAPLGVMLALLFTLTLLPALLAVVPIGDLARAPKPAAASVPGRILLRCGEVGSTRPRAVVMCTAALLLAAGIGASQIRFGHNTLLWFPEEEPLRVATELLDDRLRGISSVEVLAKTGEENALHDPDLLGRIEEFSRSAESLRNVDLSVGKTVSIVDVVKEIHKALNDGSPAFHTIPPSREAVAQELLLFENAGSDDLGDVADAVFSTARISLKVPWVDASLYPGFLDQLATRCRSVLRNDVKIEITGASAMEGRVLAAVVTGTARSYVIAFLLITPMMVIFVGRLGRGLISMIPNLVPIVLVLGLMGWAEIPIEGTSLLVGAIILGLAVDDTLHFMYKFGHYYEQSGNASQAVRATLQTTGVALLFTTLVLAAGFFTFTIAYMANVSIFGVLAGIAVLAAFLADVLLGPALMTLAVRWEAGRRRRSPVAPAPSRR
jgi:predicted RND superfamily exporter protein